MSFQSAASESEHMSGISIFSDKQAISKNFSFKPFGTNMMNIFSIPEAK